MNTPVWIRAKERGNTLGIAIVVAVLKLFGYKTALFMLYFIVFYFYLTGKKSRGFSLQYLNNLNDFNPDAHSKPVFFDGYRHFLAFAVNALDRMWLWNKNGDGFTFDIDGHELILEHLKDGRGCLFMGAHAGNFDALRVLSKKLDVTVNVIGYAHNARKFEDMQKRINPHSRVNFIDVKEGDPAWIIQLQEMINRGEIVAMMGDRFVPGSRSRVCEISFLGKNAPFPENPWIVAGLLDCPVFFVTGLRKKDMRYSCIARLIDNKIVLHRKTRSQDIKKYAQKYAILLESICKDYPYQWFNFYDFWKLDNK